MNEWTELIHKSFRRVVKVPRHGGWFKNLLMLNGEEIKEGDLFMIDFYKFCGIPPANQYVDRRAHLNSRVGMRRNKSRLPERGRSSDSRVKTKVKQNDFIIKSKKSAVYGRINGEE